VRVDLARRGEADDSELFRIYAGLFGEPAAERSRARWAWQYRDNPAAPDGPAVWVVREDGRPVGQMGTMPVSLWWAGREVRASWGMDYFVRPDAEGRGHGVRLARHWMETVEVALAVGLTPPAHVIYKRLGFRDLGHVGFFQAVLDPRAVVRRRLGRAAGALAAPVLRAGLAVLKLRRARPPRDIVVRPAGEIGSAYDALWKRARGGFAACVRRDAGYVRWKYQRPPHRRYEIFEAWRGGDLAGFAVSRHEDYRGLRLGWLADLFAPATDRPVRVALLAAVLRAFEQAGVARAQALCANAALAADLRRFGFFPGKSRTQLCVRPNGVSDEPFGRFGDWHIMFGDGDMDR
jgi:GNAT superfamily N-acetyltransferase